MCFYNSTCSNIFGIYMVFCQRKGINLWIIKIQNCNMSIDSLDSFFPFFSHSYIHGFPSNCLWCIFCILILPFYFYRLIRDSKYNGGRFHSNGIQFWWWMWTYISSLLMSGVIIISINIVFWKICLVLYHIFHFLMILKITQLFVSLNLSQHLYLNIYH